MQQVFHALLKQLQQGCQAALATIVARKGSLPMSTRAKMAIFPDGTIAGTIGGGKLEAEVIHAALHGMPAATAMVQSFDLTADQIETDGLTCGGTVDILLEYFSPEASLSIVEALAVTYDQEQAAVSLTLLLDAKPPSSPVLAGQRLLLHADATLTGTTGDPDLDEQLRQFAIGYIASDTLAVHELKRSDENTLRVFLETILPRPTVYLFGGGHISYQVARLLPLVDFDFVVVDDREAFANQQRFPEARACLVQSFQDVSGVLGSQPLQTYIVIVTRGHRSDFDVLRQVIQTRTKYIGMIGSRRKINLIFDQLRQEGISHDLLDRIHAPIGLEIGADTPEEIAVSIVAELIKVRRG